MRTLLIGLLFVVSNTCSATIISTHISGNVNSKETERYAEFHFASLSVNLNPEKISWIAWNPTSDLINYVDGNGERVLGHYNSTLNGTDKYKAKYGVNDYILLTITNPDNEILSLEIDHDDRYQTAVGPQQVIFGEELSPYIVRNNSWGKINYFHESGSHNSIFTTAGTYKFDFSFRNMWNSHPLLWSAGETESWLLVAHAPEPNTMMLIMLSLVCCLTVRVK